MPTYEYLCKACGHALEIFHSMSEAPKKKCPACGKPKLERQISSGAGIVFKGSGFYQTDYRSETYKSAAKADSDASQPAGSDARSSDSKSSDARSSDKKTGDAKSSDAKSSDGKSSDAKPSGAKPVGEAKRPAKSDG